MTLQLLDTKPETVELDDWDEVAEVSVELEEGDLLVHDLGERSAPELFELAHVGPGS